jgi:hypothetical protein
MPPEHINFASHKDFHLCSSRYCFCVGFPNTGHQVTMTLKEPVDEFASPFANGLVFGVRESVSLRVVQSSKN